MRIVSSSSWSTGYKRMMRGRFRSGMAAASSTSTQSTGRVMKKTLIDVHTR